MFVASPLVECDVGELVKLGKMFKKNNVAIDVINFGTENTTNDNTEKLEQLIAAVNTADNSHLVSIPPGPHIFADLVLTSAIMQSGGGGGGMAGVPSAAGGGASAANHPGGIDPNMDPSVAFLHSAVHAALFLRFFLLIFCSQQLLRICLDPPPAQHPAPPRRSVRIRSCAGSHVMACFVVLCMRVPVKWRWFCA